ncbi:AMP-binding protein [Arenibaculum sp.]|uniref:AMP-binding protein n=1 Tax=Arenibaculum sp. TaxID=2865862 RepID=UPI002E1418CB|nr:AMP-binding protein [Arenibaculum sp.]
MAFDRSQTVYSRFEATARRFADRPFLAVLDETAEAYGIGAGEIAYGDALGRVQALAAAYRRAGYGRGHRVGLLLANRPDFILHWLALNAAGVSVVPINPDLRSAEQEYMIGHSEMVLAVATPERAAELETAARAVGSPMAVAGPDGEPPPAPVSAAADAVLDADTECAVLYTSGTTGRPKGCLLANEYFLHCGDWYAGIGGLCRLEEGSERMLTPLPLFHMNAMACSVMAMVTVGGCLTVLDRFHPRTWWDSVRASRASVVHYLGVMPAMLMGMEPGAADRDHRVRFGFGAGVDKRLHAPFEERFGFPLIEAWAMTETGVAAAVIASHEPRKVGTSCFGRPVPEVEVRIMREDGTPAAAGEPGELLVRRAGDDPRFGFFRAYLKDPEATAAAWAGGWFRTGDVVLADGDGDLHFVDRKKNVIRRSGENISAVEVESVLLQHPGVRQVAVAPTADPVRGEEVMACIVARDAPADASAREALARDVVAWCLSRLAYYKAPGHVAFVDALPLTSTEKIQRGALRELVAAVVGTPASVDTRALKKRRAA